ncbi:hypothetical protein [Sphingobacterium siyangense]|uniref:hypothetical protein n=1 Tax=Sphingobacterium siyangense TaxID=459529 RepID=UPI001FE65472|nr:hypothetical protein [Sphingobacterium siyangense]
MTTTKCLPTAGLVSIKEDKLLLAYSNNRKAWYLPGGKIDAGGKLCSPFVVRFWRS